MTKSEEIQDRLVARRNGDAAFESWLSQVALDVQHLLTQNDKLEELLSDGILRAQRPILGTEASLLLHNEEMREWSARAYDALKENDDD